MYLKIVFQSLLQQFWSVWNDCTHMSLVFGDEFLASMGHYTWSYVTSLSQDKNALTGVTEYLYPAV